MLLLQVSEGEIQAARGGEQETWWFRVKRRVKEGMGHLVEKELGESPEVKRIWHIRKVRVTVTPRRRERSVRSRVQCT